MFPGRSKLLAFVLSVLGTVAFAGAADAGWVTFKNDTGKAIVVQEVVLVNGRQVRGKPTKLLAGESFREFQNTPGVKNYEVFDAANPPKTIWSGSLSCKADSQAFSVTVVQGKVGVFQIPEPKKSP
jgi:hypothetical protein